MIQHITHQKFYHPYCFYLLYLIQIDFYIALQRKTTIYSLNTIIIRLLSLASTLMNSYHKQKPKNLKLPVFSFIDQSHVSSIHSSKENCLSLSNQTESLLVSSLRASSQHDSIQVKKQKKLNSESLTHQRQKTLDSIHSAPSFGKNHNLTIIQYVPQESSQQNIKSSTTSTSTICNGCSKQLPQLKEKLQKTTHRLEELQALVKICFSKTFSAEKSISEKSQQILEAKVRQDDLERIVKKTQQVLVKQSVSKGMETEEFKSSITKLSEKVSEKTKELTEVIELQKGMLQQKISKISTFYDQKFDSLISMVQQLARTQQKMVNSQRQSTLSKIDFESSQQIPCLNKRYMLPNQSKGRIPSSDKARNQSKSKISYYLSKSNFNDTTTLGDTSINHLSAIGTGGNY